MIQAIIDQLAPPVRALGTQIIGSTANKLEGTTSLVRTQETNLGDIVADSIVASIAKTGFSQVTATRAPPQASGDQCVRL